MPQRRRYTTATRWVPFQYGPVYSRADLYQIWRFYRSVNDFTQIY